MIAMFIDSLLAGTNRSLITIGVIILIIGLALKYLAKDWDITKLRRISSIPIVFGIFLVLCGFYSEPGNDFTFSSDEDTTIEIASVPWKMPENIDNEAVITVYYRTIYYNDQKCSNIDDLQNKLGENLQKSFCLRDNMADNIVFQSVCNQLNANNLEYSLETVN